MERKTKDKFWVLGVSFAAFVGGVLSLQMERGVGRSIALTLCLGVLALLAVRQTLARMKKRGD